MTWLPRKGQNVYLNRPDSDEPMGEVIGYVPSDQGHARAGQPMIVQPDETIVACHPDFLLPFPYGGEEWQRANAEGRIT